MNNPKCPYCGEEMKLSYGYDSHMEGHYWYRCDNCNALAPEADSPEEAYDSAMKRERKKGKWIDFGDELDKSAGRHSYQCSRCFTDASYFISGYEWDEWTAPHFCPNCGADMREEANDEPISSRSS